MTDGLNTFSLQGKTAFIAGASRGIGLAIARACASAGAHTILAARTEEALAERVNELRDAGYKAEYRVLDLLDSEAVAGTVWDLPSLDIMAAVAGTNIRKPFTEYTREEYDRILATNVHGIVDLLQQTGRKLIKQGRGGKVITIGSLTSYTGLPNLAIYTLSKGGLAALTRELAVEWAPYNIQVNCIIPGFILTDLNRHMWEPQEMHDWLKGVQANSRLGTPEDIAPLAVFLAGRGSDYITGQLIAVDGGFTGTARWPFGGDQR